MPPLVKILVVFSAMLVAARLRLPLGLALMLGGFVLNLWAGMTVAASAGNLVSALVQSEVWLFILITAFIIEIGRFMTEKRNAEEMVAAATRWGGRHGRACSLMALPAVIGLIPMPAGALFSAPFVEQAGRTGGGDAAAEWKTAVNYWFRHVWEYWWPLYPGVIVAMSVFKLDAWQFMATEVLFTPVALLAGYMFLVRPHVASLNEGADEEAKGTNRRALFLLLPLAMVVGTIFVMPIFLSRLFPDMDVQMRKLVALLLGLIAALVVVFRDERRAVREGQGGGRTFSSLFKRRSLSVLFSLVGVLVFKSLLGTSGLLPAASRDLVASGIPIACAVAALPFLAGFVTGLALGFAGTAFPLVVGLMGAEGSGLTPLATLVLAYGFGYMGMILSPVHLCLLVTRDYFNASLWRVYRQIVGPVLSVAAYALIAYFVLSGLGW